MDIFVVQVRNEFTGEVRDVEVSADYFRDAQVAALSRLFHSDGWSKATALVPELFREAA